MKGGFKISLRANERIYVNGAVIKVDRRTSLEFLNNVQFLLENHVLQAEDATTPLRQLYFMAQVILMSPKDAENARQLFRESLSALLETVENETLLGELKAVDQLVGEDRIYDALKAIRTLYPLEKQILENTPLKSLGREIETVQEHAQRATG